MEDGKTQSRWPSFLKVNESTLKTVKSSKRILSIDVFRGITMFLLIAEFTGILNLLIHDNFAGNFVHTVGEQFHHHPWNGLRFWDLIQPFFMFIVGLSLPFGILNRQKKGQSDSRIFYHVLKRSAILIFLGWALYCIGPGKINFYFQNVLAQIGVTYLIAYLIMKRSLTFQILFSFALLAITEASYRLFSAEGFEGSYVYLQNFGSWLDVQYGGESSGGWAAINAIPTAAHTIWGVLVAQLLLGSKSKQEKLKILIIVGLSLIIAGYLMDSITPIIKRISTSSFVIVSGGWSILSLALLYWILDILKYDGKWTLFFTVIGMNSLFIYLFAHVGGADLIERILHPFTYFPFTKSNIIIAQIITSILVLACLWGICYWMYKKKLFIKI